MQKTSTTALMAALVQFKQRWFIALVRKKGGQKFIQKDGGIFTTFPGWALPGGRMNSVDADSLDASVREFEEESGIQVLKENILPNPCVITCNSDREGYVYHRTVIYGAIISLDVQIGEIMDPNIEACQFFPIDDLPVGKKVDGCELMKSHIKHIHRILTENTTVNGDILYMQEAVERQLP